MVRNGVDKKSGCGVILIVIMHLNQESDDSIREDLDAFIVIHVR